MRKIIFGVSIVITLLIIPGIVMAAQDTTTTRYFVKSNNGILKAVCGVRHNFDNGFTTDLTQGQIRALQRLGVEVEEVQLYYTLGRPVCGDGICQGNEPRTCPEDCESEPPPEPGRSCYPTAQEPYGVVMVNGGSGGAGVNVAVLDTGVYADHLDLEVSLCKDATKRGIKNGCKDSNGHGTHVAGTIAANGGSDGKGIFGVAPEANLWVVKVCGRTGCWADDIAEGIIYTTDQGVDIISMSLGGDIQSPLIADAIDYAVERGVLVVAAAGNDGPEDGSVDYPGANVKVIAVGALDINEAVPDWSSRGVNDGDYITEEREVEFGAPGVSVESAWKDGCYKILEGTSMATPHVSGLAAKLWQGNAIDTRSYLQSIAKDVWETGDDTATGFGLPVAP